MCVHFLWECVIPLVLLSCRKFLKIQTFSFKSCFNTPMADTTHLLQCPHMSVINSGIKAWEGWAKVRSAATWKLGHSLDCFLAELENFRKLELQSSLTAPSQRLRIENSFNDLSASSTLCRILNTCAIAPFLIYLYHLWRKP